MIDDGNLQHLKITFKCSEIFIQYINKSEWQGAGKKQPDGRNEFSEIFIDRSCNEINYPNNNKQKEDK